MSFLHQYTTPSYSTPSSFHNFVLSLQTLHAASLSNTPTTALTTTPQIILTSSNHHIILHNGYKITKAHDSFIGSIQVYQNEIFTSAAFDGKLKVWDTEKGEMAAQFNIDDKIYHHSISDQAIIAVGCENPIVRLCDMRTGASTHSLSGHKAAVLATTWAMENPNILYTAGYKHGSLSNECAVHAIDICLRVDQTIRKWDVRRASKAMSSFDQNNTASNPKEVTSDSRAHASAINGIIQTPDNRSLISLSLDDKIRLWDIHTQQNMVIHFSGFRNKGLVPRIPTFGGYINEHGWQYGLTPVMYVPSGGVYSNDIIAYDIRNGHTVTKLRSGFGKIRCIHNSMSDGSLIAGGDDGLVRFEPGWPNTDEELVDAWSDDD